MWSVYFIYFSGDKIICDLIHIRLTSPFCAMLGHKYETAKEDSPYSPTVWSSWKGQQPGLSLQSPPTGITVWYHLLSAIPVCLTVISCLQAQSKKKLVSWCLTEPSLHSEPLDLESRGNYYYPPCVFFMIPLLANLWCGSPRVSIGIHVLLCFFQNVLFLAKNWPDFPLLLKQLSKNTFFTLK